MKSITKTNPIKQGDVADVNQLTVPKGGNIDIQGVSNAQFFVNNPVIDGGNRLKTAIQVRGGSNLLIDGSNAIIKGFVGNDNLIEVGDWVDKDKKVLSSYEGRLEIANFFLEGTGKEFAGVRIQHKGESHVLHLENIHGFNTGGEVFYIGNTDETTIRTKRVIVRNCSAYKNMFDGFQVNNSEHVIMGGCMFAHNGLANDSYHRNNAQFQNTAISIGNSVFWGNTDKCLNLRSVGIIENCIFGDWVDLMAFIGSLPKGFESSFGELVFGNCKFISTTRSKNFLGFQDTNIPVRFESCEINDINIRNRLGQTVVGAIPNYVGIKENKNLPSCEFYKEAGKPLQLLTEEYLKEGIGIGDYTSQEAYTPAPEPKEQPKQQRTKREIRHNVDFLKNQETKHTVYFPQDTMEGDRIIITAKKPKE